MTSVQAFLRQFIEKQIGTNFDTKVSFNVRFEKEAKIGYSERIRS